MMTRRGFLALAAGAAATACGRSRLFASDVRYRVWGEPGTRAGSFRQPRAIKVLNREVHVIDRTGRVQVFSEEGAFLRSWLTPEQANGTPTNIGFDRQGNVLVPDTHYSRILEYTPQGQLLRRWGSYGTGPDQFIYPTGIVQGPDGAYYVSEYGMGAERVHVFDSQRRFIRQWGSLGEGPGQFNRMMAIALDEKGVLYVVDGTNHRVQCFDAGGKFLRQIGSVGSAAGQLKFPHDVDIAPDGTIFLCEYGNHRVSRFTREGTIVACYGRPGRNPGEFNAPRGIAASADGFIFVADTDNHRVQRIEISGLTRS